MQFLLAKVVIATMFARSSEAFAFHTPRPSQRHARCGAFTLAAKKVSFKEDARRGLVSGINKVSYCYLVHRCALSLPPLNRCHLPSDSNLHCLFDSDNPTIS
jgi:hypothetical protein